MKCLLLILVAVATSAEGAVNSEDILFTLFRNDIADPLGKSLDVNETTLNETGFNPKDPTRILIHDYGNYWRASMNKVKSAYLKCCSYNVIVVDWSRIAMNPRDLADILEVGIQVSRMIALVRTSSDTNLTIVGHGVGAHVAGRASMYHERAPENIVLLDAANSGGDSSNNALLQTSYNGGYVQSISTIPGILGEYEPIGNATFYPNFLDIGIFLLPQPGCGLGFGLSSHNCSHERAVDYFAESIVTRGFSSKYCPVFSALQYFLCIILPIKLGPNKGMGGEPLDETAIGVYYLSTNANSPYSK